MYDPQLEKKGDQKGTPKFRGGGGELHLIIRAFELPFFQISEKWKFQN